MFDGLLVPWSGAGGVRCPFPFVSQRSSECDHDTGEDNVHWVPVHWIVHLCRCSMFTLPAYASSISERERSHLLAGRGIQRRGCGICN